MNTTLVDPPDTLVALVGSSPTPPLLSALTFTPRRLVLVHSGDTARRAERVGGLARELVRRDGATALADVRLFDLGHDVFDFRAVDHRLDELLAELDREELGWRLCYTGGTKVMGVTAVLRHLDRFPDRHDWRGYIDVTSDTLRFTDGSAHPGGVDSGALTIAALAALHGVDLRHTRRSDRHQARPRGTPAGPRDPRVPAGEPTEERSGKVPQRSPEGVPEGLPERLSDRFPEEPAASQDAGAELEARVLRLFRDRLAGTPGAEVLGHHEIPDPRAPVDAIGDFDLIVRYRHRVLCVETKTDPTHIPEAAGWTLTKARRAFGAATRVLFVHDRPDTRYSREDLADYDPRLGGAPVYVRSLAELAGFRTARSLLAEYFAVGPAPDATPLSHVPPRQAGPHGPHPERWDGPLLLMGLGGSRLAVHAAAHAFAPSRTVLLYTRQSEQEAERLDAAVRTTLLATERPEDFRALPRRRRAARVRRGDYRDRVKFAHVPVDAGDAARVAALAETKVDEYQPGPVPIVADVTTGTKAMSAGLALAAHSRGGCVTYLSPITRRVSCHAHGPVGAHGPCAVDWSVVLREYTHLAGTLAEVIDPRIAARQVDVPLLDAAAAELRALAGEGGHEVAVWVDRTVVAGSGGDDPGGVGAGSAADLAGREVGNVAGPAAHAEADPASPDAGDTTAHEARAAAGAAVSDASEVADPATPDARDAAGHPVQSDRPTSAGVGTTARRPAHTPSSPPSPPPPLDVGTLRRYSAHQRPTLILTVADRAIGLTAPRWSRLRYFAATGTDGEQRISAGEWGHSVFAAVVTLTTYCGPAGLTLALHRPGEGSTDRVHDLIDWLAWREPEPEPEPNPHTATRHGGTPRAPVEEITGHEEVHRPKVLSAAPDTPAFRTGLAAHLRGLGL